MADEAPQPEQEAPADPNLPIGGDAPDDPNLPTGPDPAAARAGLEAKGFTQTPQGWKPPANEQVETDSERSYRESINDIRQARIDAHKATLGVGGNAPTPATVGGPLANQPMGDPSRIRQVPGAPAGVGVAGMRKFDQEAPADPGVTRPPVGDFRTQGGGGIQMSHEREAPADPHPGAAPRVAAAEGGGSNDLAIVIGMIATLQSQVAAMDKKLDRPPRYV